MKTVFDAPKGNGVQEKGPKKNVISNAIPHHSLSIYQSPIHTTSLRIEELLWKQGDSIILSGKDRERIPPKTQFSEIRYQNGATRLKFSV